MKKINAQQVFVSLILLPLYIVPFHAILTGGYIIGAILVIVITYFIIRFLWRLGVPDNLDIYFNENTIKYIGAGICPICGNNKLGNSKLTVGYHKRRWQIAYRVFYMQYTINREQLSCKVNLCDRCKSKYLFLSKYKILSLVMRNPSKVVLAPKIGYIRGLQFPFETWNVS